MRAGAAVRAARGCALAAGALGFCCLGGWAAAAYAVGLKSEADVGAALATADYWRGLAGRETDRANAEAAARERLRRAALAQQVEIDRLRRQMTWGNTPWYIPAIPADDDDVIPPQRVPTRGE